MNPIIAQTLGYAVVFFLSIFFFNFLSSNFLLKFVRAKASRGRLIFIRLEQVNNTVYCLGKIDGNMLKFKSPAKKTKSILVSRTDFYRELGVSMITIDDETNTVRNAEYVFTHSHDAEDYDNKLVRSIEAPQIHNNRETIIILIALVIIVIIAIYTAYNVTQLKPLINTIATRPIGVVN